MIASVLIHPAVSVVLGAVAIVGLWLYWALLGMPEVPPSRRKIRRLTTMLLLISMPPMICALSFIDRVTHPIEFVLAWTFVFFMMLLVMAGGILDALNSVRLHQQRLEREVAKAAKDVLEAARRRESDSAHQADTNP
jgi:hypothetical protein